LLFNFKVMGIIALIVFGFLLLAFILVFRKTRNKSVHSIMQQNHDVPPLFKERSAKLKYQALHEALKNNPIPLQTLKQLKRDYQDKLVNIEIYHDELEELERLYLKH
jgi:hypothetical protein